MLVSCISVTYITYIIVIYVTVYIHHFCITQVRAVDTAMFAGMSEGSFSRSHKSNQTRHAQ